MTDIKTVKAILKKRHDLGKAYAETVDLACKIESEKFIIKGPEDSPQRIVLEFNLEPTDPGLMIFSLENIIELTFEEGHKLFQGLSQIYK